MKISIQGLCFGYKQRQVLRGVDLEVPSGSLCALLGANGAGKTTLLKCINGILRPQSGRVFADDTDLGGLTARERARLIGYVPQSPSFDRGDPVSVLDLFIASIADWPVFLPTPKKLRERVLRCLSRVHAEPLVDKRIGSLSGGELQRVLLAMALEPVPHILILDEPLSGVDIEGERQLLDMLDEVRQQYDLSILLSTHDFATLEEYADKVILLQSSVLKSGPPREVLSSHEFRDVFHLSLGRGWSN